MKRGAVVGLVVAGVLVLGVGGAVVAASVNRDDASTAAESSESAEPAASDSGSADSESTDSGSASSDSTDTESTDSASTGGSYVDYSEEALASAEGTRLLFFYASWCPKCRALDADIKASGVPEGYTILKVGYNTNQDLLQKYGVNKQTTVVALDESGEKTGLHVAYEDTTVNGVFSALDLPR